MQKLNSNLLSLNAVGYSRFLLKKCKGLTQLYYIQSANLIARSSEEIYQPYPPFPYWRKRYNYVQSAFDGTFKRIHENSKIIVVEGNPGVGKTQFAQRLADEFGLLYVPPVTSNDLYSNKYTEFDFRSVNYKLPKQHQIYDIMNFHQEPNRRVGLLQWHMLIGRLRQYQYALQHLLNTGQGAVLERSAFSDLVFAKTLLLLNYYDKPVFDWYMELRANTIIELWRPHLCIYLDAPADLLLENIKKSNQYGEADSKVITAEYLNTLDTVYKEDIFPYYRRWSHLLVYDHKEVHTDTDWDIIKEELECLDLDGEEQSLFQREQHCDWSIPYERLWNEYRREMSNPHLWEPILTQMPIPTQCLDLFYSGESYYNLREALFYHPAMAYRPSANSLIGFVSKLAVALPFAPFLSKEQKEKIKWIKNDVRRPIFDPRSKDDEYPLLRN